MNLTKTLIRATVIGGLATGGLVLIAGPDRVAMLAGQARDTITSAIDDSIDDPVALRNQLRELEEQYPERIANLQGELASLDQEIAQLERDRDVAERVVELASEDLDELSGMLEEARAAREVSPAAVIKVHFNGAPVPYDQAISRAAQIRSTYNAYAARLTESDDTLAVLNQQRERLASLLNELTSEHEEFRAQIAQLDGQIAAIERNEKLITMVEQRERAIREYDKSESVSVDQVRAQLARTRAEQEARLSSAINAARSSDYADRAEEMLTREAAALQLLEQAERTAPARSTSSSNTPERIDITPNNDDRDGDDHDNNPSAMADANRITID